MNFLFQQILGQFHGRCSRWCNARLSPFWCSSNYPATKSTDADANHMPICQTWTFDPSTTIDGGWSVCVTNSWSWSSWNQVPWVWHWFFFHLIYFDWHLSSIYRPVIIEVPHFASLRGKEREIVILRSDNGETWREHTLEASEEAVLEVLNASFDGDNGMNLILLCL